MSQRNELKKETVKETKEVAFTAMCEVTAKSTLWKLKGTAFAATLPQNKLLICRISTGFMNPPYDSHKMIDLKTFEEQLLPFSMRFTEVIGAVDDTLICAYCYGPSYQIRLYDLKTGKMTPSSLCGLDSNLKHHGTELLWINQIYSDNGNDVKQVRIYSLPDISAPRYETPNLNDAGGIWSAALFKQNHLLVTSCGGEVRHYQREDNFKEHKKLSEEDNTFKELVVVGDKCVFMINRRSKREGGSSISCWTLGADNTFKKCKTANYDAEVHGRYLHYISTGSRLITFEDKSFFVWDERLNPARIDVDEDIYKILVCQDGKEENDIIVQTWSRKLIKMSLGPIGDLKYHLNHFFPSCYQPLVNSRPVMDMIADYAEEDKYAEPVAAVGAGPGQG